MLKTSLIAAACMLALASVSDAQQSESKNDDHEPALGDAQPAGSAGESSNRNAITMSGSARSDVVLSTAVSQSGMRAPVLVPVTPFVSYAVSGPTGNDAEAQARIRDIQERERRLLQLPEYRDLLHARHRLSLAQMHPDLPELLQISKEQADEMLELLAEQQVREQAESKALWPSHGDVAAVQAFMEKNQERQTANEAELEALLGASKFQEWKEYEQSKMARFLVQRLQNLLPHDANLRAEQLRPLVRAIAREQREPFEDRTIVLPQGQIPDEEFQKRLQDQQLERMAAANRRVLDASAAILSPRQLEHLRSMLQQELEGHSQRQFFFGVKAPLSAPSFLPPQR